MSLRFVALSMILSLLALHTVSARNTDNSLSHFRVFLGNGEQFEGRLGLLTENLLIGRSVTGRRLNIDRKDIIALETRSGSRAGTGAAIGACAGFALALGASNSAPRYKRKWGGVLLVFLGSMGLGAVVGGAIGTSFKKWQRVNIGLATGFDQQPGGGGFVVAVHF